MPIEEPLGPARLIHKLSKPIRADPAGKILIQLNNLSRPEEHAGADQYADDTAGPQEHQEGLAHNVIQNIHSDFFTLAVIERPNVGNNGKLSATCSRDHRNLCGKYGRKRLGISKLASRHVGRALSLEYGVGPRHSDFVAFLLKVLAAYVEY